MAVEEGPTRRETVLAHLARSGQLAALEGRGFTRFRPQEGHDLDSHQARLERILSGGLLIHRTVPLARVAASELDADLGALLEVYRGWVATHGGEPLPVDPDRPIQDLGQATDLLAAAAARRHLSFPRPLLAALLLSWRTGPLVLLSGPAGSGKSTLVRLLGDLGASVHTCHALDEERLRELAATAGRDSRHQHVVLLEAPPRRACERSLLRWLDEQAEEPGQRSDLLVAWTLPAGGSPPSARLLDRVNVLRLQPPAPGDLPSHPAPPPPEPPGILTPELLRPVPGGWRELLARHDGPVAAGKLHLEALLRETQEVLARHGASGRISWRQADGLLEYGLTSLAAQLARDDPRTSADQQLRQRLLPPLLRGEEPLAPEQVEELCKVWSPIAGEGPGSACALLRACQARPRAFWSGARP